MEAPPEAHTLQLRLPADGVQLQLQLAGYHMAALDTGQYQSTLHSVLTQQP
jgi:hypothetical protein